MSDVRQGMGREQKRWLERIRAAGGEVIVKMVMLPVAEVPVVGGKSVRLPIRMFESLSERDLFEEVNSHENWTRYRLIPDEPEDDSGG